MPNLGKLLNDEIRRLSLRASRPYYTKLKKDLSQLKRSASALKKENTRLLMALRQLRGQLRQSLPAMPAASSKNLSALRIGPKLVRAQRKRLGLSRMEFAKLLGVSAGAILSWETAKARPRDNVKAALAGIRRMGRRAVRERLQFLSEA